MTPAIEAVCRYQRERLAYLELRAYFTGELRRSDIESRFGVKPAASSRDLKQYRDLATGNLFYDQAARCYRPSESFVPLFAFDSIRVLSWLLDGFGDGLDSKAKLAAPCEGPGHLFRPDLRVMAAITRAICGRQSVSIDYMSVSSGVKNRKIVPLALADNGLRWHVRAYDRSRNRFGDFVVTRISNVTPLPEAPKDHETLQADEQWARVVELELVPHPGLPRADAIQADYGMVDGVRRVKARAALAGYVLRRWAVDASPDHNQDPASHHLWLRNHPTLYGVESAALAPGYPLKDGSR